MSKTVVVTGGSSGIGRSVCELFSQKGFHVYEFSRSGRNDSNITHITCDITDENAVKEAFFKIPEKGIDILINNAGYGISGALELTDISSAKQLFQVNLFGQVFVIQNALNHLRESKGKIINVTSVAGQIPIPFQAYYSASKSAFNSLTLALRNELRQFGITVCAVMPGDTKTGFTSTRKKQTDENGLYSGSIERSVSRMEKDEQSGVDSLTVAKHIYRIAMAKNSRPVSTVGFQYQVLVFLSRILPQSLVNRIVYMLYGK